MNLAIKRDINRVELIKYIGLDFPNGKGVEVGTFKGEFSKDVLEVWGGTLFMVDVWSPLGGEYNDLSNHGNYEQGLIYGEVIKNTRGYENRSVMVRASSELASTMFADESLDFVYIDANHAYDFVVQDIKLWYPKVKKGGYLCGHDYIDMNWNGDPNFAPNGKDKFIWSGDTFFGVFGVNPAVDEFCQQNSYEPYVSNEWCGSWWFKKK